MERPPPTDLPNRVHRFPCLRTRYGPQTEHWSVVSEETTMCRDAYVQGQYGTDPTVPASTQPAASPNPDGSASVAAPIPSAPTPKPRPPIAPPSQASVRGSPRHQPARCWTRPAISSPGSPTTGASSQSGRMTSATTRGFCTKPVAPEPGPGAVGTHRAICFLATTAQRAPHAAEELRQPLSESLGPCSDRGIVRSRY